MQLTIPSERPRERCLDQGAKCLSLRECLAVVLGTGSGKQSALTLAEKVLSRAGADLPDPEQERAFFRSMESGSPAPLLEIRGIGDANRARLLASFEISRRYAGFRMAEIQNFISGADQPGSDRLREASSSRVTDEFRNQTHEWLGFIPVYPGNRVGQLCVVERGVRTHVNTDPAELFARLLALRPRAFFLMHNHPSGDLRPSWSDIKMTAEAARLAAQFGIELLSHGVVSATGIRWIDPKSGVR